MPSSTLAELALTGVHVAFWAQLGVLTRIYLAKLFTDGCMGYWGFCLLSQGESTVPLEGLSSRPASAVTALGPFLGYHRDS